MKIEQAGSTIFQTMAGWILDTKHQSSPTNQAPGNSSRKQSVQSLLNIFVFVNVLELIGVLGLSWLDKRQKMFDRRMNRRPLSTDVSSGHEGDSDDPQHAADHRSRDQWADSPPLGTTPDAPEEVPLISSSTPGQERQWSDAPAERTPWQLLQDADASQKRARRGKICAVLCCVLIVCAWVFFLTTAALRLRSQEDRGTGSNSTIRNL